MDTSSKREYMKIIKILRNPPKRTINGYTSRNKKKKNKISVFTEKI